MPGILVSAVVSDRDKQPYVHIKIREEIAQLSMAQARTVARHIEVQCARAEADAMLYQFFVKQDLPLGALHALLTEFRDFRSKLDGEDVETTEVDDEGPR